MESEMTTAEMVSGLKRLADICTREDEAVLHGAATRLSALDKVAKAADRLAYGKLGESGDYWVSSAADVERLHNALKEAGYGT